MIKQYIKQAIQSFNENRLVGVLSILGTALAVAVTLVLVLVFQINSSGFEPESNRDRFLYIFSTEVKAVGNGFSNRGNMSAEVVRECFYTLREPEAVAAYFRIKHPVSLPNSRQFRRYECCFTDAGYWNVFDHQFVEGRAFTQSDFDSAIPKAVISQRMARRFFGEDTAVGKQLVVDFVSYTVAGVVKDVPNPLMVSYFDLCMPYTCNGQLMALNSNYGENMVGSFSVIMLARSSADFELVRAELDRQSSRYNEGKVDYKLDFPTGPLSQLDTAMGSNGFRKVDWREYLLDSGFIFLLLLLVPALNLMGVVHTSIQKRGEEIALRKAFGATKGDLLFQILVENLLQTLVGGVLGLLLSVILLLASKSFMLNPGIEITPTMLIQPGWFAAAFIFTFLLNLLSAGLPAWGVLRRPLISSLRGSEG